MSATTAPLASIHHSASRVEHWPDILLDFLVLAVSCFLLFLAYGLKGVWLPYVLDFVPKLKIGSLRDCYCIGYCASCLCPGTFEGFHEPFRLRIIVHEGWQLRCTDALVQMECFVAISCGTNPTKNTLIRPVPRNNAKYPVVWEDAVDLEIQISDSWLDLEVWDYDGFTKNDLVGSIQISATGIYNRMEGDPSEVRSLEWQKHELLWRRENGALIEAGFITLSFFATKPSTPLPPILPGMAAAAY